MKLRKYNEAFQEGHLYDKDGNDTGIKLNQKDNKYNSLYIKTIFNDLIADTKELLDLYFVDLLDNDAETTMVRVNGADHKSVFARYRIIMLYDIDKNAGISGIANYYENFAKDLRYIETQLEHLESEYENRCIYDEEGMPNSTFVKKVELKTTFEGKTGFLFILDIK
jgi:hypothetical protein